jgi:CheY-like chemotaxis protein
LRFGEGRFDTPIEVVGEDELAALAEQANQMAARLARMSAERDHADWIRRGQNGLAEQLRGELSPAEVAARGVTFLAAVLEAPVAALYVVEQDRTLRLLAEHAGTRSQPTSEGPAKAAEAAPVFAPGEGLVGQAASGREVVVVSDPPPGYLRVRSGLGESPPRALLFVPLTRGERVVAVLELAFFKPVSSAMKELLGAVGETFAIALDVARARVATRELLAQTQRQAERLSHQEEALRASNEELQAQQEELTTTNADLARQARELDAQRRMLETRNADLDDVRHRLEQKAAELTTVSNYKSQFLANMSHELRTPLNSMLLLSNLLAENESKNLTAKQVEYARTVYQAGRDLLALINQVLDLAKVESGKHELRVEQVPLADVANRLERVFGPLVRDKGLAFEIEIGPDLPEVITTDRQRLDQILNNLLGNALKFTSHGKVAIRIVRPPAGAPFRSNGLAADRAIAFEVRDTGVGIAPADQERVFAPFEQVEASPDRRYGGTGLGLSIAREIAVWLGGELRLESKLGEGSTFTCYLPEAIDESGETGRHAIGRDESGQREHRTGATTGATSSAGAAPERSLLLIEDDPAFALAFGEIIKAQGLRFRVVETGRAGLEAARATHPTGIVLDIRLPDIDGWSVLQHLREDPATKDIPVHVVSALDGVEHGLAMGASGYLTKPATRSQLLQVVQALAPPSASRRPRVLVVEDDGSVGPSLVRQLTGENLDVRRAGTAAEALRYVEDEPFACMILDLSLPDMDGLELLQRLRERCGSAMPAVVVYTGRALTKAETNALEAYTEAIILKEGSSKERLLDEIRLFVRRLQEGLGGSPATPSAAAPAAEGTPRGGVRLEGRKILVVDDDMRTVYALSATLRAKGADVLVGDTGQVALSVLDANPDVEAVLMDVMMPEMDGYEAMRRIRKDPRFGALPIVALTAKAMKGDEEKCREAGATAYMPKPVDADRLLPLLHALLKRSAGQNDV